MTTDNFCFYLQNRLIQTSQTGGQWYSDTSPFSIPCLGCPQLASSLSPVVNKLFGGILSWAQTLITSFTERQLSHKVHAYLVHNSCLTHSQGTKNTKKSSCPSHSQLVSISFITCSQMIKHMASEYFLRKSRKENS
jgi:hypothetical protein